MWIAIAGISLEIIGFGLMVIISPRKLVFKEGDFVTYGHVDPSTGLPPKEIEGPPIRAIYRPGIILVMIGLGLQIVDIIMTQMFKVDI